MGLFQHYHPLVTKIPDFIISMVLVICITNGNMYRYLQKVLHLKLKFKLLMSIPVAGTFFSIVKTRDFSGEIGGLLQSGFSLQNALDVLIDQNLDAVLSEIAKNVKEQVVFGESFHTAIQ